MSWVPFVSEEQEAPLRRFLRVNWGFVPNYFLALGHQPQFLQGQVNLSLTLSLTSERYLRKSRNRSPSSAAASITPTIALRPIWRSLAVWASEKSV